MSAYGILTTQFDRVVDAAVLAAEPFAGSMYIRDTGLRPEAAEEASALARSLPGNEGPVQILLDMSGSYRGVLVETVRAVDLMARTLEAARIPFEVVGFTTSTWSGGRSGDLWAGKAGNENRERNVGRVCDLLHVIFKEMDAGWDVAKDGLLSPSAALDAIFRPPYLRENVDGEALRWARSRHGSQNVQMIFFTDGEACDAATRKANDTDILAMDRSDALASLAGEGIELTSVEIYVGVPSPHGTEERLRIKANIQPAEMVGLILSEALAPRQRMAPGA